MKFYRRIEYYKLYMLVFELSALDICEKKISFVQSCFMEYLYIFFAVKNTKAKVHYSGHLSWHLPLIYLINSFSFRFYQILQVFKKILSATPLYNMMFHVILFLVLVVFQFHNYFRYIRSVRFYHVYYSKPITHSDNGSTRKKKSSAGVYRSPFENLSLRTFA